MAVVNWNGNIVDIVDIVEIVYILDIFDIVNIFRLDIVDKYLHSPGWVWLICAGALKAAEGAAGAGTTTGRGVAQAS